jgi:hypothetical protein
MGCGAGAIQGAAAGVSAVSGLTKSRHFQLP